VRNKDDHGVKEQQRAAGGRWSVLTVSLLWQCQDKTPPYHCLLTVHTREIVPAILVGSFELTIIEWSDMSAVLGREGVLHKVQQNQADPQVRTQGTSLCHDDCV
jgi:hypothetical protein